MRTRVVWVAGLGLWIGLAGIPATGQPGDAAGGLPDLASHAGFRHVVDSLSTLRGVPSSAWLRVDSAARGLAGDGAPGVPLARYLLDEPLRGPRVLAALAGELDAPAGGGSRIARALRVMEEASGLRASPVRRGEGRSVPPPGPDADLAAALDFLYAGTGKRFTGRDREVFLREASTLPTEVARPVAALLVEAGIAVRARDVCLEGTPFREGGLFGSATRRTRGALLGALRGFEALPQRFSRELSGAAEEFPFDRWYAAAARLAGRTESLADSLDGARDAGGGADFRYAWPTPAGTVAIGGVGADRYDGAYLLVVDLGGDDTYRGAGAVTGGDPGVALVIDLGGNDRYLSEDDGHAAPGGAILGFAGVVDLAGNDTVAGRAWGAGFGFLGVGWVDDRAGDDTFSFDALAGGAGLLGLGLCADAAGDDVREIATSGFRGDTLAVGFSLGFGGPGGVGFLLDDAGADRFAGGPGTGALLGAASGISGAEGGLPGGFGLLLDGGGDDAYSGGVLALGAGRDAGIGVLLDRGGSDRYGATAEAMGCGRDAGVGLFLEAAGDDTLRIAGGDGPGFGARLGLGLCLDVAGDDCFDAGGPGPGFAALAGVGLFVDLEGRDGYRLGGTAMVATGGERDTWRLAGAPTTALAVDLAGPDVLERRDPPTAISERGSASAAPPDAATCPAGVDPCILVRPGRDPVAWVVTWFGHVPRVTAAGSPDPRQP